MPCPPLASTATATRFPARSPAKLSARCCVDAFARPAERGESPERRGATTALAQPFREITGRLAVTHEANDARTLREMRYETLERRGMKPEAGDRFEAPAEPRGGEREGRGRRMRDPLVGIELLGEHSRPRRARTDRRRRAPPSAGRGSCSTISASNGTGHGTSAPLHASKREMTLAAKNSFCLGKRLSACFGQPGKAIFADTDDGQPGISHDARPHSGRNRRRELARRGGRARAASTPCIPMAAAPARPPISRCRPASAASAASSGLADYHSPRAHHACDRRDASLRRRDEPPRGPGVRANRHAADRAERAPWTKAPGDNWIEVADVDGRGRRAARGARQMCSSPSAGSTSRPSRRKPQHAYTLRFVDPPEAPLPFAADVIVSRRARSRSTASSK